MIKYERQQNILSVLQKKHFCTISDLAKSVYTSESSVRRDIEFLEKNGYVYKIYGGVVLAEYKNSIVPVSLRDGANSFVKDKLASAAVKHIYNNMTIIMDGSSTVMRICKYLDRFSGLKIITNNQRIFEEYSDKNIQFYCTGGRFLNSNKVFVGKTAEDFINGISADILFFSSQAISENGEISDMSEEENSIRKVMLKRAKKKIMLCDSSKIGQTKTFKLCDKEDVDIFISDTTLP